MVKYVSYKYNYNIQIQNGNWYDGNATGITWHILLRKIQNLSFTKCISTIIGNQRYIQ